MTRLPEHKSPARPDRIARAPYNFVPLPEQLVYYRDGESNPLRVDQRQYHTRTRLTGFIDVELETRSPVYVRGPLTPEEYEVAERQEGDEKDRTPHLQKLRNKPDFFFTRDPDTPVIPGSSLRGMLRTLVQILGYGKLDPVMDTPLVYRAVADSSSHGITYRNTLFDIEPGRSNYFSPKYKAGYLGKDDDGWFIQPAITFEDASFGRIEQRMIPSEAKTYHGCKNTKVIYVRTGKYRFYGVRNGTVHIRFAPVIEAHAEMSNGLRKAVVAASGGIPGKHTEAVVYELDPDAGKIRVPDGTGETGRDLIAEYRSQITEEQKDLLGLDGVLQPNQPVFYLMKSGGLVFFGHSRMMRMTYPRSPREMLPPEHRSDQIMDLAEAMFGTVKGPQGGQAGRVFVTDAVLAPDQGSPWLEEGQPVLMPRILSGPKPTTFQHYLTQDNPDVEKGRGLHTYNDSPRKTTLRGFKLYWHKGDVRRNDIADDNVDPTVDTQHTRMKPVRSGLKFRFRIHFENLLPVELGLLWWALDLPVEGTHFHKIGMGKPHGLGAVHLRPTLQIVDPQQRYRRLLTGESQWAKGLASSEMSERYLEVAVQAYERLVRTREGLEATQAPTAARRIQMLLEMLSWPGPDQEETRYLEIERPDSRAKRGKRNEYKDRPGFSPTPCTSNR